MQFWLRNISSFVFQQSTGDCFHDFSTVQITRYSNCIENVVLITLLTLQHFDPNHIDGCVGPDGSVDIPLPPPPPPPPAAARLPPPVFGSPDPLITHIGSPLTPGSSSGFSSSSALNKRSPEHRPALEISGDNNEPHTQLVWPS